MMPFQWASADIQHESQIQAAMGKAMYEAHLRQLMARKKREAEEAAFGVRSGLTIDGECEEVTEPKRLGER